MTGEPDLRVAVGADQPDDGARAARRPYEELDELPRTGARGRLDVDSRCREILERRTADAPCADQRDPGAEQLVLALAANLPEDDVAGVSVELVVAESHRPVEPKPPAPRSVAPSSSTSRNSARSTGAGTSWAIRSPRRTSNGSAPRLARITFTSPR